MVEEKSGGYVVNVKDAGWTESDAFGRVVRFEQGEPFSDIGIHLFLLEPGKPNCRYHRENAQENFLVLSGRCKLLMNGEERALQAWDFVHCPPGVTHVLVGDPKESCSVLAIGHRKGDAHELFYPKSELAARYGAEAPEPTDLPQVAYSDISPRRAIDPQKWPTT